MSIIFDEIEQQVRGLAPNERARLAEVILESLQDTVLPEVEADWQREVTTRVAAYGNGETKTYPASDVFAEAKRIAK